MRSPFFDEHLRCPACRSGGLRSADDTGSLACKACSASYACVAGRPILFDPGNSVFCAADYLRSTPGSEQGGRGLAAWVPTPSINLARVAVLDRMRQDLDARGTCNVLAVGGGRQRSTLEAQLQRNTPHRIVCTDVDAGADIDLFCDGHDLPFVDACFDAVITTAVLEHVLYPERVAEEIARVLKPQGLLYSELPFMQQVHEGAYDFTRYTLSGHRRLFNRFTQIDAGMVAGPATALVWALENFALAFLDGSAPRKIAKALVRLLFAWLKHFDRLLVHRPAAMDGASCTYFYGAKADQAVDDQEVIHGYVGAKHLSHS